MAWVPLVEQDDECAGDLNDAGKLAGREVKAFGTVGRRGSG